MFLVILGSFLNKENKEESWDDAFCILRISRTAKPLGALPLRMGAVAPLILWSKNSLMNKSLTKCRIPFRHFQEAPIIIIYAYKLNGAKYLRKSAQCAYLWHFKAPSRLLTLADISPGRETFQISAQKSNAVSWRYWRNGKGDYKTK